MFSLKFPRELSLLFFLQTTKKKKKKQKNIILKIIEPHQTLHIYILTCIVSHICYVHFLLSVTLFFAPFSKWLRDSFVLYSFSVVFFFVTFPLPLFPLASNRCSTNNRYIIYKEKGIEKIKHSIYIRLHIFYNSILFPYSHLTPVCACPLSPIHLTQLVFFALSAFLPYIHSLPLSFSYIHLYNSIIPSPLFP